ncbi:MAG TPA: glycosyltransferase family 39 protein [Phycisphaerae bacterium]|nr:glycosyltransferase family 39 protein [Phycisphaerae bacterium]
MPQARRRHCCIAWRDCLILLVIGLVVRSVGLDFGLPCAIARPDEETVVDNVLQMENLPDWNPRFFSYPSLLLYTSYGCDKALLMVARLVGTTNAKTLNALFIENPVPFHLVLRVISVICGAFTVVVVYLAARRLYGRQTGLLAGLAICLSYLHVRDSHFGVTDVPCVFLAAAAFWRLTEYHFRGGFRHLAAASILAGLAIGTKYTAAWLCCPFAVAVIRQAWRRRQNDPLLYGVGMTLASTTIALGAFYCTTPYFFHDFDAAWKSFTWEMLLLSDEKVMVTGTNSYLDHFRISLWYGLGWPVLLAALAGGLWMALRRDTRGLLLWSLPVTYYLFTGRSGRFLIRYMDITLPFLTMAAAWTVRSAYVVWKRRRAAGHPSCRQLTRVLPTIVVLIMLAPGIVRIVAFDQRISRTDSRADLRAWMLANIPADEPVLWSGGWASMPYMMHHVAIRRLHGTERVRPELLRDPEAIYAYRWIVLVDWPRVYYSGGQNTQERAFLAEKMAGRYALVHQIDEYKASLPPELFCSLDYFFMSFQKPWILDRPGPGFRVYRRLD